MLVSKHSVLCGALSAFSLLPALVDSFDCSKLINDNKCPANYQGSLTNYPECLVSQWGVSAFIQCATQKNAPQFPAGDHGNGDTTTISALEVLTNAINGPACDNRPIKGYIEMAAQHYGGDVGNFARYLCDQYHPLNAGMCFLRRCLNGPAEHSIEALCAASAGNMPDLMDLPTLPKNCDQTSSGATSDKAAPASETTDSSSDLTQLSTISDVSATSPTSSAISTTSPTASTAPSVTATSSSPTPRATSNTAAILGQQSTYLDFLKRLGGAVFLILAIF
jgi:hypothetical protein